MDIFDQTILEFLAPLHNNSVRYIMVHGIATNLHGYQRYTGDMDIWLEDTIENRKNLRKAFSAVDMGDYEMMERIQFVPGWTILNLIMIET